MGAETVGVIVMAVLGSNVLQAVVTAIMQRRKVSADAADALSKTAMQQLQNIESRLLAAEGKVDEFRRALYVHDRWDRMVLQELYALGKTDIPDPPELRI